MCPWASITAWQQCLMLFTSRLIVCWGIVSHSSWSAARRSLRFWGTDLQASTRQLSWSHRFSMGFWSGENAGHSIWGTLVSSSRSLMMRSQWAGALLSMKMKLGLCCSCRGTMTTLMMLFRYYRLVTVPFTKCRAALYWLDTCDHTVTPPPPKARLVTTVTDASRSPWRLQHHWRPSFLLNVNGLSSENSTEDHWSLVQHKCSLAHAIRWCLCLVVWSGTLVGHLAHRPRWWKRFPMVWCNTWVPLTSFKCAWSRVAFILWFRRALFTIKWSSVWDVARVHPLLCLSVALPVSLYLYCNLLMTLQWRGTVDQL